MRKNKSYGFSLVELAIVLVVISLIIGSILAGQEIVKSAQLRKIYTDFVEKEIAVNTFYSSYGGLPGDLSKAYSFWGNNCNAVEANCNGNGNNVVDFTDYDPTDSGNEFYMFWRHLFLAEVLTGSYSGEPSASASSSNNGVVVPNNVPRISRDGVLVPYASAPLGLMASKVQNGNFGYSIISYEEAFSMDKKYDDGNVEFTAGKIRTTTGSEGNVCSAAINTSNTNCIISYTLNY